MTLVTSIRSAMATNLATVTGFQINQYVIGSPTPPTLEIDYDPEGVNYDEAMGRGLDEWWFVVRGFVAYTTDQGAQSSLDDMLAPTGTSTSVKASLESDRTLGGHVQTIHVTGAQPRTYQGQNGLMLGCEWRVRVLATGTAT